MPIKKILAIPFPDSPPIETSPRIFTIEVIKEENSIIVGGLQFLKGDIVYIDNQPTDTVVFSSSQIKSKLPNNLAKGVHQCQVVRSIQDREGNEIIKSSNVKTFVFGIPTLSYGYEINKFDKTKTEIELVGTGFQDYPISSVWNINTPIASGSEIIIENNKKLKIILNQRLNDLHIDLKLRTSSADFSNEIRVEINQVFIAVFGDSVAWGQGLREDRKMYSLVAEEIRKRSNMIIQTQVLAHSGANIGPEVHLSGSGKSGPEVPNTFPTILEQVDNYQGIPENVDFVLVIGGINDIGVQTILTSTSLKELTSHTHEIISERMTTLLRKIEQKFKNARIIVPGYYQIISEDSDVDSIKTFLILLGLGGTIAFPLLALTAEFFRKEISLKCKAFSEEANRTLSQTVSDFNSKRIFFVDPGFTIFNALAAQNSLLWEIFENDDVRNERVKQCEPTKNAFGITDPIYCNDASMGHPNPEGAKRYANLIISRLFPPVPDPCKHVVDQINSLKRQITNLQTELKKAPTPHKPDLVDRIRGLNAEVKAKNVELTQCRINNPTPSPEIPPILN